MTRYAKLRTSAVVLKPVTPPIEDDSIFSNNDDAGNLYKRDNNVLSPLSGETNTASNLGDATNGSPVFSAKVGTDLQFKRLKAGDNVTITDEGNDLKISASGAGGGATYNRITSDYSIPINQQMVVFQDIQLDADLEIIGELIVL